MPNPLLSTALLAAAPFFPFGSEAHPPTVDARPSPSRGELPSAGFLSLSFTFYRRVLSPIDGPRCAHRPTCSLYAQQAVSRHGVFGLFLAMDRLQRGEHSSAVRLLPRREEDGRVVLIDPLEESAFWF